MLVKSESFKNYKKDKIDMQEEQGEKGNMLFFCLFIWFDLLLLLKK
jgi:hypothetical protein